MRVKKCFALFIESQIIMCDKFVDFYNNYLKSYTKNDF